MKQKFSLSLMDEMMVAYCRENNGLCMKKFHADIITNNIDYSKLNPGDIISIDYKKIRLTKIGKPCFAECDFVTKPCLLSKNVAFGEYI